MGKIVINTINGKEYIYDYDGKKNGYSWDYAHENYINIYQNGFKIALFNANNIISLELLKENKNVDK